jgi:cell division protein FtsB
VARPKQAAAKGTKGRAGGRPGAVLRSRLILLGAVVLSAGILAAWFPASSLFHQRASLASATTELRTLHAQDSALAQEKKNLNSSAEISRIARSEYQLVSPGQQAYEVLPPAGQSTAGIPYAGDPGGLAPVAPSATSELPPGDVTTTTVPPTGSTTTIPATHGSAQPEGLVQRMLHTLEFWR